MFEVTLIINAPDGVRQVVLDRDRLTIGRTDHAAQVIPDEGLSRLHASINRGADMVWILDEHSTNGTFVNNAPVPANGTMLKNGDEISLGNHTTIRVLINQASATAQAGASAASVSRWPVIAATVATLTLLVVAATFGIRALQNRSETNDKSAQSNTRRLPTPILDEERESTPVPTGAASELPFNEQSMTSPTPQLAITAPPPSFTPPPQLSNSIAAGGTNANQKLYLQMSPPEQMAFVEQNAQHVAAMMGNRPYAFTPEALDWIKRYVDGYARRVGNNSTRLWGEDLRFMFARARTKYTPYIIRAFNARGVPRVVGVYLCVIETEYHNIESENFAGAAGLFQFIGPTAEAYGVPRGERTNVEKMAPAAAAYIAHRIAEFGTDSMSVALGIAGYNRNPDSVRRDLRDVLNSENKERSFWTLVVNSTKLDHYFQGENIKYVPKFFAAAIVGEHPWAFGLNDMRPLSTYDELPTQPPQPSATMLPAS